VAATLRARPDVCLLDVDMPGGGITAAARICSSLPDTPVVMLSELERDQDLFAALDAGASGYLLKEMNPGRLGPALRDVMKGGAALPRPLTARLILEFRARARRPNLTRPGENELTSREWDVVDCLREGLSTRRIAKRLFISETTVRRHVGSIRRKLGVSSREEAVDVVSNAQKI
jgi:two-component system nitrate/nitrite response regulator NarL